MRRALFPLRRTVQSSPHWAAEKLQAGDSFVERIHAFLSLLARLLLHTGNNYAAVLKHTNLIEQRNQCGIVLLFFLKKKKKTQLRRHYCVDMMGPNMLELDAKCYQQCGMMTHLQLAGACARACAREREGAGGGASQLFPLFLYPEKENPQDRIQKQLKYYNYRRTCLINTDVNLSLGPPNI